MNSVRIKSSYNEALKTITRADIVTDTDGEFALPTEYNFISGAIKIKAVYIDDKLQVKVLIIKYWGKNKQTIKLVLSMRFV